jgi:NAD(P)-dependent dehydrogenase (short-subunit alcohol dehydrogenase family)
MVRARRQGKHMKKTALVTGANTGMGKETARELARAGLRVVMTSRRQEPGEAALREIAAETGNRDLHLMVLDLSSQAAIREFAREFLARFDRLDILVNNAGVSVTEPALTPDGIEWTVGVNAFGPFLLTQLLLDLLKRSAPSRIVTVASGMHAISRLSLDQYEKSAEPGTSGDASPGTGGAASGVKGAWSGNAAYADSKLMNILFTYELSRRLAGTGVTATCAQPGLVNSEFFRNQKKMPFMLTLMLRLIGKTPAEGARTAVYLALSPDVEGQSGVCYDNLKPARTSSRSRDPGLARRFWDLAERLTGT